MRDLTDRGAFLNLAALFEGGLALAALGLAWVLGVDALGLLRFEWRAVAWGVAGALPIFGLFVLSQWFPVGPLRPIKRFLVDLLGPSLNACRWYDLVLLALLAGVGEELLFRGVLQTKFEELWGLAAALVVSNVIFGLAHLITPLYAAVAGVIGVYLGLLLHATPEPNLLTPILAHAVYDYLAFVVVVREYRSRPPWTDGADERETTEPPNGAEA